MAFTGDLSTVALKELFHLIISTKKEGTLIVYDANSRKEIYFGRDTIRLLSTGKRKGLPLGELLVNKKIITPPQLTQALTIQKTTTKKLGEILCHLGFIKQNDIDKILRRQIEDEIYDLFKWADAKFEFIDASLPPESLASERNPISLLTLDVNSLLLKLNERSHAWENVKDTFSSHKSIFKLQEDYEEAVVTTQLTQEEKTIFPLISGFKTLDDLVDESPLEPGDTYRVIKILSQKKVILEIAPGEIKEYIRLLRKDKKLGQALFFCQEVLKNNPNDLIATENMAEILEKLDRSAEAGAEYKKLGEFSLEHNDIKMAIASYKKALQLLPADDEIYMELFNLMVINNQTSEAVSIGRNLVEIYARSKKADKILTLTDKIAALKGLDLELRSFRASAYLQQGKQEQSRQEIKQAIKELPAQDANTLSNAYQQIFDIAPDLPDIRNLRDSASRIIINQQKKKKRIGAVTLLSLLLLLLATVFVAYDYLAYKRFVALKKKISELKYNGDIKTALVKCQNFKCPFALYTKSAVNREIHNLMRLAQNNGKTALSALSNELDQLKEQYEHNKKEVKTRDDAEAMLKMLQAMEIQTSNAINNLPQRALSLGGDENIIKAVLDDYQQFHEQLQNEIVSTEKHYESARVLYNKAGELERANQIDEAAHIIKQIVTEYPDTSFARNIKIPVWIESHPSEADVTVNDTPCGKTPLRINLPAAASCEIKLLKKTFGEYSEEIMPYEQPHVSARLEKTHKWRFDTKQPIETTPQAVDDTVYITTRDGTLKALNSADGSIRWIFQIDTPAEIYSSPSVHNNFIFFGADDNYLYAVRTAKPAKSSQLQLQTHGFIRATPFYSQDGRLILIASNDKNLYAMTDLGALFWTYNAHATISTAGATDNNNAYITTETGMIHVIDLNSGDKVWTLELAGKLTPPILSASKLYTASTNKTVYAINLMTRQIDWSYHLPEAITAPLTVIDDTILVPCRNDTLYCIDSATRKLRWQFKTAGPLIGGAAASPKDEIAYFGSEDCYLYALSLADGKELWKYKTNNKIHSTPAIDATTIYVCSDDCHLYAIEK